MSQEKPTKNKFIAMREEVNRALQEYKAVKEKCEITDSWHMASIESKARPFLNGYFTLAVVGKMSSGKSTFINAFLGDSLLPTGHFQTTSAITYIEDGESHKMVVTFCDEHKEIFEGAGIIKKELRDLVSIPKEYSSLPINDINLLIDGDDPISEILKKKEGIEDKTMCPHMPDELWEKYVAEHPKAKIARRVQLYLPLQEEFKGWRIIDTPGIGAIGGIQNETKDLFSRVDENRNKIVDAIIFLQSGSDNIEDSSTAEFVKETFAQLTEDARKRLIFILTKASKEDFRNHREDILEKLFTLYSEQYNIQKDRLTYVDSLLARFCDDVEANNIDIECITDYDPLPGWSQDDWDSMVDLLLPAKREIKTEENAPTNETIIAKYREWANFEKLQKLIQNFVAEEKQESFDQVMSLIQNDYNGWQAFFKKNIRTLESGLDGIEKKRNQLKDNKIEYNKILAKLQQDVAMSKLSKEFDFIDNDIDNLTAVKSIERVRTEYYSMIDKSRKIESGIFSELKKKFNSYCEEFNSEDIILQSIDFDALEEQAEEKSLVVDKTRPEEEVIDPGGLCSSRKTKTIYPHKISDKEIKLREFKAFVINEIRSRKKSFLEQLERKVGSLCDVIDSNINVKIRNEANFLEILQSEYNRKEELIKLYQKNQEWISTLIKVPVVSNLTSGPIPASISDSIPAQPKSITKKISQKKKASPKKESSKTRQTIKRALNLMQVKRKNVPVKRQKTFRHNNK